MIEARADATLPVDPETAWAAATDFAHADWLPAVRRLHRLPGPAQGKGARYAAEVRLLGRQLEGILVCSEWTPPRRAVLSLESGLDLTITIAVAKVSGGCRLDLEARYAVGGGLLGGGVERASAGPARREVGRAVEQLAARFRRNS